MNCGIKIIKYLVFIFNLVFFLTGLLLVIFGGIGLASGKFSAIEDALEGKTSVQSLAIGLIVFGVIVMIISFLGCCGAYKESSMMLIAFAVIITVIFIAEIIIGIVIFVKRGDIMDFIDTDTDFQRKLIDGYYKEGDNQDSYRTLWDEVQAEHRCCGYDGFNDWGGNPAPDSCGKPPYQIGCKEAVIDSLKANVNLIGVGVIILALIQIVAIVFACCLARAIKSDSGGNKV